MNHPKVTYSELTIHGVKVRGTVIEEDDPKAVEEAEEFLAQCAARNVARGLFKLSEAAPNPGQTRNGPSTTDEQRRR